MQKLTIAHVNSYMAVVVASAKKHQITQLHFTLPDLRAHIHLLSRASRYADIETVCHGLLNKRGTINATLGISAELIGRAFPLFVLGHQGCVHRGI